MLKFGQKVITTKDLYGQRQITDIFTIDVNRGLSLIRCHAIMERTVIIL